MTEPVRYEVDLRNRAQHLLTVSVTVPSDLAGGGEVGLELPRWTPGSYVIRDFVHHVQRVWATRGGVAVEPESPSLSRWTIPSDDGTGPLVVHLEIYGYDHTVRTNHVDDLHALIIPAASFPAVDGAADRRHEVVITPTDGHRVHGMLPTDGGPEHAPTFVADDYLHLIDSAFEVGDFRTIDFDVHGVPHHFVYAGHGGNPDLERIAKDSATLAEECVKLFGGDLPVDDYTFLCTAWDQGGGGLEHRDGSVVSMPVRTFHQTDGYARFQSLVCHEYLHLWNVKRLTPAPLVRPDLMEPTQTELLWVAEGWTAYYDELLPTRARVWGLEHYLRHTAEVAQGVCERPGALVQSVERASAESWIKAYIRDENSLNVGVDYYGHGAMLAWSLDLLLRQTDPTGPGLDGVFRTLWSRFGSDDPDRPGYTSADVRQAVEEAAGRDMGDFFEQYVAGATPPPIRDIVEVVGLRFDEKKADRDVPSLGIRTSEDDRGITVTHALAGQPAWEAGISGGDVLVAVDGLRVQRGQLADLLAMHEAGDEVEVAVFRGPRLVTTPVVLGAPSPGWTLVAVDEPDDDQRAAFEAWIGHRHKDRD